MAISRREFFTGLGAVIGTAGLHKTYPATGAAGKRIGFEAWRENRGIVLKKAGYGNLSEARQKRTI